MVFRGCMNSNHEWYRTKEKTDSKAIGCCNNALSSSSYDYLLMLDFSIVHKQLFLCFFFDC